MTATPDSADERDAKALDLADERDAKALDLADNVTETARVLAVEQTELARLLKVEREAVAREVARQLRWFRRETRFLFVMAFIVILLDRAWPA